MTKKEDVKVGQVWEMRLSTGRFARVRVISIDHHNPTFGFGGRRIGPSHTTYSLVDCDTKREFSIRSATKLRRRVD